MCFIKFIGLSECVCWLLYHLVRRTFIEGFNVCNISLHGLFRTDLVDCCIYDLMERTQPKTSVVTQQLQRSCLPSWCWLGYVVTSGDLLLGPESLCTSRLGACATFLDDPGQSTHRKNRLICKRAQSVLVSFLTEFQQRLSCWHCLSYKKI